MPRSLLCVNCNINRIASRLHVWVCCPGRAHSACHPSQISRHRTTLASLTSESQKLRRSTHFRSLFCTTSFMRLCCFPSQVKKNLNEGLYNLISGTWTLLGPHRFPKMLCSQHVVNIPYQILRHICANLVILSSCSCRALEL